MLVYVGNLPFDATDGELGGLFARFGTVVAARVAVDRTTGRPHGFGYVDMADGGAAAVAAVNGAVYRGRTLVAGDSGPPRAGHPAPTGGSASAAMRVGQAPPRKKVAARAARPTKDRRREVFRALVEAQDGKATVTESRRAVARTFGLSDNVIRAIEEEGLTNGWPPL
jgi:RNA recognition motif-containing protein